MADELQSHRIEVICPACGHQQSEPARVVSTQCRNCLENFQVVDGKGIARARPMTRLAKPKLDSEDEPTPSEPRKSLAYVKQSAATPAKQSIWMRLLNPIKPPREVTCLGCGHSYHVAGEAQSSQCPKCGNYMSLLDYSIDEHWNRRIQTSGNVVIQKAGRVAGVTLRCHHLTVLGELAGSVECTGDLIIRSHGKIVGKVHCRNLRIEKGAKVEFLNPVTADSAFIDGMVRGQISCSGPVVLEKRAELHGLVRTSSLVVRPGAKHSGTIEMHASTPS